MEYKKNIKAISITDEELTKKYGNHRRTQITNCFKSKTKEGHFYCQMSDFVLHVKKYEVMNKLHNSSLVELNKNFEKIDYDEFKEVLLNTIFELGIYEYTKNKK